MDITNTKLLPTLEDAIFKIQEHYQKAKNGFPNSVQIPKFLYDLMNVVHSIGVPIDHEKEKMRMLLAQKDKSKKLTRGFG
jgi:hypothetical protein